MKVSKKEQQRPKKRALPEEEDVEAIEDYENLSESEFEDADADQTDLYESFDYGRNIDEELLENDEESDGESRGAREFVKAEEYSDDSEASFQGEELVPFDPTDLMRSVEEELDAGHALETSMVGQVIDAFVTSVEHQWRESAASSNGKRKKERISYDSDDGADTYLSSELCRLVLTRVAEQIIKRDFPTKSEGPKSHEGLRSIAKKLIGALPKLFAILPNQKTLTATISWCAPLVPLIASFQKQSAHYARALLQAWGSVLAQSDDDLDTFISLSKECAAQLAALARAKLPLCHIIVRLSYLSFCSKAKVATPHSLDALNEQLKALLSIFKVNPQVSYHFGYLFIRQLALHVRTLSSSNASTTKNDQSKSVILGWQFVFCVKFWCTLLGSEESLRLLIFPFVSIVEGLFAVYRNPGQQLFPLVFHCCHALCELSQNGNTLVPFVAMTCLRILESVTKQGKRAKKSILKPLDFATTVKAQRSYWGTRVYVDAVIRECVHILLRYASNPLIASSACFAETTQPIVLRLKGVCRAAKNPATACISDIVEAIKEHSQHLKQNKDTKLLPIVEYYKRYSNILQK